MNTKDTGDRRVFAGETITRGSVDTHRNTPFAADPTELESIAHEEVIRRSHDRSSSTGLKSDERIDPGPDTHSSVIELVERHEFLRRHAAPVMETLYEQIINTHSMVVLTNENGVIVHALGDDDFLMRAQKVALTPGVSWAEEARGTNAIGTALIEQCPTLVHGKDHFLRANHFLTCSAAPIFDPTGLAIGVLDVTGDYRSYHKHTMALIRMSAQMIENHLFLNTFNESIILHFHTRGEFLGTLVEGIVSFTQSGRFLGANRAALIQLGLPLSALQTHTFSSLFGMPISSLIDHYRASNPSIMSLCLHNGVKVFARAMLGGVANPLFSKAAIVKQASSENLTDIGTESIFTGKKAGQGSIDETVMMGAVSDTSPHPHSHEPRLAESAEARSARMSSLRYLDTGDTQVATALEKVRRVIGRDIPILILGETGTGKELLAKAVHNDSPRASGPFVAVNCASIPDTLIESELFGYEDGAFTGAKRKGSQGKILQANGGTLFLDEIGDMPVNLQARLLRVLQERVVTPLGSQKSIPVNVMVICATHRNIRDLIAQGDFREDLYYRLNGLVIRLPALRDRSDLQQIVEKVLLTENNNQPMQIDGRVMDAFCKYNWPGNIRQLSNLLRTACVMASGEDAIRWEHLPEDFIEDWFDMQKRGPLGHGLSKSLASNLTPALPPQQPPLPPNHQHPQSQRVDNSWIIPMPAAWVPPTPYWPEEPNRNPAAQHYPNNGYGDKFGHEYYPGQHTQQPQHAPNTSWTDRRVPNDSMAGSYSAAGINTHLNSGQHPQQHPHMQAASSHTHHGSGHSHSNQPPGQYPYNPQGSPQGNQQHVGGAGNHHSAHHHFAPFPHTANHIPGNHGMPANSMQAFNPQTMPGNSQMKLDDVEFQAIQQALEASRGNVSAAARLLGVSRNTIYRRLHQHDQSDT